MHGPPPRAVLAQPAAHHGRRDPAHPRRPAPRGRGRPAARHGRVSGSEPTTAAGWLAKAEAFLAEKGVPEASVNAEFLLAEALGVGRGQAKAEGTRTLTRKETLRFWETVKSRGRRIPLAYVLGWQPFAGCRIEVDDSVLIPRPETEELVELAAREAESLGRPVHIVDVGTGSGCVAIALARRLPDAVVYATDVSSSALRLAESNAMANHVSRRVKVLKEDLFKPHSGAPWADVAVSNPPYIPSAEVDRLEPEVLKEPRLALDGGKDGLLHLRAIAGDAKRLVKPGGRVLLEFGAGQAADVRALLVKGGLSAVRIVKDAQGMDRFAAATV
ncbi:peptide chain release factor N(5)-glutamine methyltransferase [bacterium]|nr:MAG: peptide chain release factor N(5)-glutamine methyltransferase [bacterium]